MVSTAIFAPCTPRPTRNAPTANVPVLGARTSVAWPADPPMRHVTTHCQGAIFSCAIGVRTTATNCPATIAPPSVPKWARPASASDGSARRFLETRMIVMNSISYTNRWRDIVARANAGVRRRVR